MSTFLTVQTPDLVQLPGPQSPNPQLHAVPANSASPPLWPFPVGRCAEKGCVFPALAGGRGICRYHTRLRREPSRFQSQQPSCLLLEKAKFGITDPHFDYSRAYDARIQTRLRETFLEVV